MSVFTDAFTMLLGNEGGYSNNPADPGGETMYGITARVARAHGYEGPMRNLPLLNAQSIAKTEYWDCCRCDELPPAVAFQVFDACYNSGYERAAQWLQQAAGVYVDNHIGPLTVQAVQRADPDKIIMRFDAYRLDFLASLNTWPNFGKGWARRIANNLLKGAA